MILPIHPFSSRRQLWAATVLTGFLIGSAAVPPCFAQQIIMKNGQAVMAQNLKRVGDQLMSNVEIAGQIGQVGYAVANIDHLDIPKPPQMIQAEQTLAAGKFAQVIPEIDPVIVSQYPFRDIKGNFWAQATLLKTSAQIGLGDSSGASALLTQLSLFNLEPAVASIAKARLAGILAQGGKEKAGEAILLADEIIATSDNRAVLAEAYLAKGRAFYAQDNYGDALMSFLNLPVFYDQQPTSTAAAVLGSARCYMAMGDTKRGVRTYLEIQEQFPSMPEAAAAKSEIEKGGARLANIATELKNEKADSDKQFRGEEPKKDDNASEPAAGQ